MQMVDDRLNRRGRKTRFTQQVSLVIVGANDSLWPPPIFGPHEAVKINFK